MTSSPEALERINKWWDRRLPINVDFVGGGVNVNLRNVMITDFGESRLVFRGTASEFSWIGEVGFVGKDDGRVLVSGNMGGKDRFVIWRFEEPNGHS